MAFERVLAVGAHPDDCEFFAGGTLAGLARAGARVALCVCSDGSRGGPEGGAALAARRRGEAEAAARELGAAELAWLGHPDGALRDDDELIGDLVREIRRVRPLLVLAHDPRTLWTPTPGGCYQLGHTDHRAAGRAVLAALYPRAALASFFPDQLGAGLAPWWVPELWLFDSAEPDHAVDVSGALDAKRAALARHASQSPETLVRAADARSADGHERFRRLPLGV